MSQNPDMADVFTKGNMDDLLPQMAKNGEKFDVINMSRVLDMCLDAEGTLQKIAGLMTDTSIFVLKVSHNYSPLQQMPWVMNVWISGRIILLISICSTLLQITTKILGWEKPAITRP